MKYKIEAEHCFVKKLNTTVGKNVQTKQIESNRFHSFKYKYNIEWRGRIK